MYLACAAAIALFLRPVVGTQMAMLLIGAGVFGLIGLIDDLRNVGAVKLAIEAAVVVAIVWFGGFKVALPWPYAGEILAVLWIVGVANAVNCLDSTDGVTAGMTAIGGFAIALLAMLSQREGVATAAVAVAGAALGFLRYNFPPARIFLGDAGSLMLGFFLAALTASLAAPHVTVTSVVALALIPGMPACDFLLVHLRRYLRGTMHPLQILTSTGKDHLPHRLLRAGLSPLQVALWIYGATALLGATAVILVLWGTSAAAILAAPLMVLVALGGWWPAHERRPAIRPGVGPVAHAPSHSGLP